MQYIDGLVDDPGISSTNSNGDTSVLHEAIAIEY